MGGHAQKLVFGFIEMTQLRVGGTKLGCSTFNPLLQMPSGVYLTFFGSFVFGTPGFPLSDVPLREIAQYVPTLTPEVYAKVDAELAKVPKP